MPTAKSSDSVRKSRIELMDSIGDQQQPAANNPNMVEATKGGSSRPKASAKPLHMKQDKKMGDAPRVKVEDKVTQTQGQPASTTQQVEPPKPTTQNDAVSAEQQVTQAKQAEISSAEKTELAVNETAVRAVHDDVERIRDTGTYREQLVALGLSKQRVGQLEPELQEGSQEDIDAQADLKRSKAILDETKGWEEADELKQTIERQQTQRILRQDDPVAYEDQVDAGLKNPHPVE